MKYKLVVFDMDGTILDTLADLTTTTNYVLAKHGYPPKTKEEVRRAIGDGIIRLLDRSVDNLTGSELEEFVQDFLRYYHNHADIETLPYDGMVGELEKVRKKGYKLAVATNKDEKIASALAAKHFPGLFDAVVGYNYVRKGKPSFDMFEELLKMFNITKDELFFFGDSNTDAETIIRNDIKGCIVLWGLKTREELVNYNLPKIDKVTDISKVIEDSK